MLILFLCAVGGIKQTLLNKVPTHTHHKHRVHAPTVHAHTYMLTPTPTCTPRMNTHTTIQTHAHAYLKHPEHHFTLKSLRWKNFHC